MTLNNVSLAAKLSNTISLKLEMDKKINLKLAQEPEDKIISKKAKRKAAFMKNLDTDGY